ncbi:hypothetical protein [Salmonella enterica]|nr:hypothetical protein [Salmonella enterica]
MNNAGRAGAAARQQRVLLMAAMLVVLGALLPLVHKQLGLGSISVGAVL